MAIQPLFTTIGGMEWVWVLLVIVILLFGSQKLPELARGLGKAMGEFHKARAEFEREVKTVSEATKMPEDIRELMRPPKFPSGPGEFEGPSPPMVGEANRTFEAPRRPVTRPPIKPPEAPSPPKAEESDKIAQIAKDLGINPTGKSREKLREEIKKALEKE